MPKSPKSFKPRSFKDPQAVLDALTEIYESNIAYLRTQFGHFVDGKITAEDKVLFQYVIVSETKQSLH